MKRDKSHKLRINIKKQRYLIIALVFVSSFQSVASSHSHYKLGSQISDQVTVTDQMGSELSLQKIISTSGTELSVVFIFGGGGMGHVVTEKNGGLWCPDSYEDINIIRSLHNRYEGKVGIILIALPPVFHSEALGYERGLFFKDRASPDYEKAVLAFIDSTQTAFEQGTIPIQPFYDSGFNLLVSQEVSLLRENTVPIETWHGAFRAKNEMQHYGVPSLWLVDSTGKIVAEPFRGNVYRPHSGATNIIYTLQDVVGAIEANLQ
jgi:hypothetical protein